MYTIADCRTDHEAQAEFLTLEGIPNMAQNNFDMKFIQN